MAKRSKGLSALRDRSGDVVNLIISYLKQETLGPLKSLGRFVAYGAIGSVFLGIVSNGKLLCIIVRHCEQW